MNIYSDKNPPERGTGLKIYRALKAHGLSVHDLHYNFNCWGRGGGQGWGTWACAISDGSGHRVERWCGWDEDEGAYLQGCVAPYACLFLRSTPKNRI